MPTGGYWDEVRKQCRNYKLLDRKIEQDLVMSLAIIVKLLRASPRGAGAATSFEYHGTRRARRPTTNINARTRSGAKMAPGTRCSAPSRGRATVVDAAHPGMS
jgi:hypothetical protein